MEADSASTQAAPRLETWWDGFADPELTSLVDRALAQNLDLAQAQARVWQARAQAKAAGAALVPAGELDARAAYSHQSLDSPLGRIGSKSPAFDRNQQLFDLNVAVSWEVDLFGGLQRSAQAARARYEASDAARVGSRLTVAAQTADDYVLVRTLQTRLVVAEAQVLMQRQFVALVELQYRRGVAARLQLDQAQGALAGVAATIPVLKSGLESQLDALAVMLGQAPGALHEELQTLTLLPEVPGIDARGGPFQLVRRRPDVIAAERTLAEKDAQVGAAIAGYYPKVSLSGLLGYESDGVGHLVRSAAFQPQGLIDLRWRLFDFGRVDAEVAAARGARAEALAAYRKSVLQATAEVESSLVAVAERQEQARMLEEAEAALARARAGAQAAYQAGQVSLIEVLQADDRLLKTRDERVQAKSEAVRAAISAFKALGGGWASDVQGT